MIERARQLFRESGSAIKLNSFRDVEIDKN
jgi:hypothetical protein